MNWTVPRSLTSLRDAINTLAPGRDKGSDGTIGDTAHQAESSDHNPDDTPGSRTPHTDPDNIPEVHALDIDVTGPWPPRVTMLALVQAVIDVCKAQGGNSPLSYIIYSRHIYEYPDWNQQPYYGSDPHTGHIHFSARYGSGNGVTNPENFNGPWKLDERFAMLTNEDKNWIGTRIDDAVSNILAIKIDDVANPNRSLGDLCRDIAKLRGVAVGDPNDTKNAKLDPTSPLGKAIALLDSIK